MSQADLLIDIATFTHMYCTESLTLDHTATVEPLQEMPQHSDFRLCREVENTGLLIHHLK